MFNIKFPIRLIILLIITVLVNIFSTVTIKYNAISLQEFRKYEIVCIGVKILESMHGNSILPIQIKKLMGLSKERLNYLMIKR